MSDELIDATAGAVGALVTTVALYPVDVAKTRVQAGIDQRSIPETILSLARAQGVTALMNGVSLKSVESVLRNFLYFYAYNWLKRGHASLGFRPSTIGNTVCGVLAGVSNLTVTLPIELLSVRIQTDDTSSRTVSQHASDIIAEGPSSLWRGFEVSSILTLNPALTFAIFDELRSRWLGLRARAGASLTAAQAFILGAIAKSLATILTYPLMRAKTIMQAEGRQQQSPDKKPQANGAAQAAPRQKRDMARVLLDVYAQEGFEGLYRGCAAQIFTAVTKSGILLTAKERIAAFAMALLLLFRHKRVRSSGV